MFQGGGNEIRQTNERDKIRERKCPSGRKKRKEEEFKRINQAQENVGDWKEARMTG